MVQQNTAVLWFVPCQAGHQPTSLHPNLTAFALYNHACYNIEILIKLLTFFIQCLQTFFYLFLSPFLRFNVFFILI